MAEVIAVPQKSAQGTVTPEGTLVVHEPGSGKLLGEVRVSTPTDVRYTVQQARATAARMNTGWRNPRAGSAQSPRSSAATDRDAALQRPPVVAAAVRR